MKLKDAKKFPHNAKEAGQLLKALSNPARLLILCQLIESEQSAGELSKKSALSQSAFSQHLAVLRKKGLVKTRKEGQTVFYSLANDHSIKILEVLYQLYCK